MTKNFSEHLPMWIILYFMWIIAENGGEFCQLENETRPQTKDRKYGWERRIRSRHNAVFDRFVATVRPKNCCPAITFSIFLPVDDVELYTFFPLKAERVVQKINCLSSFAGAFFRDNKFFGKNQQGVSELNGNRQPWNMAGRGNNISDGKSLFPSLGISLTFISFTRF